MGVFPAHQHFLGRGINIVVTGIECFEAFYTVPQVIFGGCGNRVALGPAVRFEVIHISILGS